MIAHELSHIGNYDIRVMTITVVLVGLVALLADLFMRLTWFGSGSRGSNRDRGGGACAILLVVAIAVAILAPIAAQLIQLAISRQREYLADASGALLSRNPDALARRAGEDHGRPGPARRGEQGDGAPLLRQPAARPQVAPQQPLRHPPADRGAHPAAAGDVSLPLRPALRYTRRVIKKVHHVGVVVRDMEQAMRF